MGNMSNGSDLSFSIDNILREDFGPQRNQERTVASGYYIGIPNYYPYRLYYPWSFPRWNFVGWLPGRNINSPLNAEADCKTAERPRDLQSLEPEDRSSVKTKDYVVQSNEEESDEDCSNSDDSEKNTQITIRQGKYFV